MTAMPVSVQSFVQRSLLLMMADATNCSFENDDGKYCTPEQQCATLHGFNLVPKLKHCKQQTAHTHRQQDSSTTPAALPIRASSFHVRALPFMSGHCPFMSDMQYEDTVELLQTAPVLLTSTASWHGCCQSQSDRHQSQHRFHTPSSCLCACRTCPAQTHRQVSQHTAETLAKPAMWLQHEPGGMLAHCQNCLPRVCESR